MENSEKFKDITSIVCTLEQHIKQCDEINQRLEKEHCDITTLIEEHFDKCLSFLAARKIALLDQAEKKWNDEKNQIDQVKITLQDSMSSCTEIIKAGTAVYSNSKNAAEHIWEGAKHLPIPKTDAGSLSVVLTGEIFDTIQNYGKGILPPFYCKY
jgi:hypothetical protein